MTNSAGGGPGVTGSTQVAKEPSIIGARRGGSLLSYVALFKQRSPHSVFTQRATDSQKHDLITCESTQATLHAEPAIDTWTIGPCCSTNMFCSMSSKAGSYQRNSGCITEMRGISFLKMHLPSFVAQSLKYNSCKVPLVQVGINTRE